MRLGLLLAAAAAALSTAGAASAGAGWEFTAAGNSYTNGTWDFATAFTVNSNVTVSGLGYYADPVTGNADGNPVAFYHCDTADCLTTGTLLATATVTNIYALNGHFRYVTISPIDLVAGESYEVAGVSNADNYTWDDPGFATDPSITLLDTSGQFARWQARGDPAFLTGQGFIDRGGEDGYWGPNIYLGSSKGFTGGIPEPAAWALMIAGFGLAGVSLRRRRAVTA
jgi:hypothetical protein